MSVAAPAVGRIRERLLDRNAIARALFAREAPRLAQLSHDMAARFTGGGRLLALGRGAHATDAQHVVVEFVHPVIVGKRALPAVDVSLCMQAGIEALVQPQDIVFGFGPPAGDVVVHQALAHARDRGALTVALPGDDATCPMQPASDDAFIHQEVVEVVYHVLWETVHVFLEHATLGHDVGDAGFLYPFLGNAPRDAMSLRAQVAESILAKVADDATLRTVIADTAADNIAAAAQLVHEAVQRGGRILTIGNGGSATDANDLAIDCIAPPPGYRPIPAISLSSEPATLTAIANDVGVELMFLRQLIAVGTPDDVLVAISTSGGSRNIQMALAWARKAGMRTVGLLGSDGGDVVRQGLADVTLVVPSDYIPRIQEVQASIYHVLRDTLEDMSRGLS